MFEMTPEIYDYVTRQGVKVELLVTLPKGLSHDEAVSLARLMSPNIVNELKSQAAFEQRGMVPPGSAVASPDKSLIMRRSAMDHQRLLLVDK